MKAQRKKSNRRKAPILPLSPASKRNLYVALAAILGLSAVIVPPILSGLAQGYHVTLYTIIENVSREDNSTNLPPEWHLFHGIGAFDAGTPIYVNVTFIGTENLTRVGLPEEDQPEVCVFTQNSLRHLDPKRSVDQQAFDCSGPDYKSNYGDTDRNLYYPTTNQYVIFFYTLLPETNVYHVAWRGSQRAVLNVSEPYVENLRPLVDPVEMAVLLGIAAALFGLLAGWEHVSKVKSLEISHRP